MQGWELTNSRTVVIVGSLPRPRLHPQRNCGVLRGVVCQSSQVDPQPQLGTPPCSGFHRPRASDSRASCGDAWGRDSREGALPLLLQREAGRRPLQSSMETDSTLTCSPGTPRPADLCHAGTQGTPGAPAVPARSTPGQANHRAHGGLSLGSEARAGGPK